MKSFFLNWLVTVIGVLIAEKLLPGINADSYTSLAVAALVLGVLNAILKPVLVLLSLPFLLVTLGLFMFVINGLLLLLVGSLVPGFHVDGFWTSILGALIVGVISMLLRPTVSVKSTTSVSMGKAASRDVIDV